MKVQHPIWKPSPGMFVDPDLRWHPGSREFCIKSRELEGVTTQTGLGLSRGKSKSSRNPRDLDLRPLTFTASRNHVLGKVWLYIVE